MSQGDVAQRAPLLETRLYGLSPLPLWLNGACISAVLYVGYVLIAQTSGQTIIEETGSGLSFNPVAWAALVMSLIFGAAMTMPVMGLHQWRAALPDLEPLLDEAGLARAHQIAIGPERAKLTRNLIAFGVGAVMGVGFNIWLISVSQTSLSDYFRSVGLWFAIVSPVLFGLGARAAHLLNLDDRDVAELVQAHLVFDLARLEDLQVFGRLALSAALTWLVMAAIILLFFVYSAPVPISVGAIILAFVAAAYAFATTVGPVVKRATQLRDETLKTVRTRLQAQGTALLTQAEPSHAAATVSELSAYEDWVLKRPIWPVSAPITRRLALYGFIPVIAWFGAAAAELVLGRLT